MADRRGLTAIVGVAALGLLAAVAFVGVRQRSNDLAADFVLPDLKGQAVRLSALRGKVVLVNVWTTWCPPCREEMPSMERLFQKMAGRDFQLLAVSEDEGEPATVEEFVRTMQVSFPVLLDPEHQVGDRYGVWGYPETFIVDRAGRLAERVIGPRTWDAPATVAQIERLLETSAVAGEPREE
ncbi:MAG: TlpA disulfide reductase family protein [Candidatus Binatia bacterium]